MSKSTSPAPEIKCLMSYTKKHRLYCSDTLFLNNVQFLQEPGSRTLMVQGVKPRTYHVCIETKGFLLCSNNCGFYTQSERKWRMHVRANLHGKLLRYTNNGIAETRVKPWLGTCYCCDQTHTLACNCSKKTGWVMLPQHANDVFYRMGLNTPSFLDKMSISQASDAIKKDRQRASSTLDIATTHWLTQTLDKLIQAPVYAVLKTGTLVFSEHVDARIKLRPAEVELLVGLLEATGAQCPITCLCKTRTCFKPLRDLFTKLNKTCGLPGHNVICKCKRHA